jgi:hypothetical protein
VVEVNYHKLHHFHKLTFFCCSLSKTTRKLVVLSLALMLAKDMPKSSGNDKKRTSWSNYQLLSYVNPQTPGLPRAFTPRRHKALFRDKADSRSAKSLPIVEIKSTTDHWQGLPTVLVTGTTQIGRRWWLFSGKSQ